jgi:hypothetical protein
MTFRGQKRPQPNAFRRNDAVRAIQSARDAGLEPAMIEIITEDGTTFRIYGDKAIPASSCAEPGVSKEWQNEIDKLKKPK